jgi:hypothetical protein
LIAVFFRVISLPLLIKQRIEIIRLATFYLAVVREIWRAKGTVKTREMAVRHVRKKAVEQPRKSSMGWGWSVGSSRLIYPKRNNNKNRWSGYERNEERSLGTAVRPGNVPVVCTGPGIQRIHP